MDSRIVDSHPCRVCGSKDFSFLYEIDTPRHREGYFLICNKCKCYNFYGKINNAYLDSYYGSGELKIGGFSGFVRQLSASLRAHYLAKIIKTKGICLDVGCGDGDFLLSLSSKGWRVVGTELAGPAFQRSSQRVPGQIICSEKIEEKQFKNKFNLITLWQVFEHLENPLETLQTCRSILHPGGILAIGVPNPDSMQAKWGGKDWLHLDPPRHLALMGVPSLVSLANISGFEVVSIRFPWFEFGPIGWIQTIFNKIHPSRDLFFESLKSNWIGQRMICKFFWFVLAGCLAPLACVLSVFESLIQRSATYEIYFKVKNL
jgi:SAM-dependent methyltransferase